ncbi:Bacteriophage minor tail subunit [Mycobacteroides abscessus subsp. massiliense]|uniref:hypothetical protein n=1 Tax=Mycobacteroides abscessus TaxID=36809 RepID=UPI0009A5C66A|nr:hypothetical protein [Mycobacteroides abscessus]SKM80905.1 Bacteriophage minor tail subunit [Mycobacteroides abscessus subsp. massiliense]SKM97227.1 Bacteriophage minor tail subunit [Mycobacteroides abscessus subsp. massiliense]SKN76138.1 Bacteriophage minor tail subunit [Mycobacteroides abscessus subsp. massiliense]SKN97014.1 Bacteriophage minor tail subunit [Mycobacteroides abscessus subsp. massiliense]SKO20816.1 Bacteriophage minor tail subunit [Mycobacteroides abscessus subsp. massilien
MSAPVAPTLGLMQYLKSITTTTHVFAVLSDGETPDGFSATIEISGDQATLTIPALVGPQGPAGQNAFAMRLQLSTIDDPEDLPTNLTNTEEDIGKYWVMNHYEGDPPVMVGSRAYVWFGDHYKVLMMGSQGPVGPVPEITWGVELLDPDGAQDSYMSQSGSPYTPSVIAHLRVPRGPVGPSTNIASAPDVDMTTPPRLGQVLAFNGTKWAPLDVGAILPRPFTVPEAAFTNFQGVSTRAPIGSFAIPAQPFNWKPMVWGKVKATGVQLNSDPFIIGCEVRLGNPTSGPLIARGFGNTSQWAQMSPHASSPTDPVAAITPDNTLGLVTANHTGNAGTVYVNLYNDGSPGAYMFDKANAQLFILVVPV